MARRVELVKRQDNNDIVGNGVRTIDCSRQYGATSKEFELLWTTEPSPFAAADNNRPDGVGYQASERTSYGIAAFSRSSATSSLTPMAKVSSETRI